MHRYHNSLGESVQARHNLLFSPDNKRRKQQNSHFSDTGAVRTLSSSQIKEIVVGNS